MTPITDLVFDLYGTLVDIHTDETPAVWEKTALFFGYYNAPYSATELKYAFTKELQLRQATAGQSYECFPDIPFHEILADLFRQKGICDDASNLGVQAAQLFRICSTDYIRLYPQVKQSLLRLRQHGYRLWLLTNAQDVFTRYELNLLGIAALFDGIYISSVFGFRKPDQSFFRTLLEENKLSPTQCLMIGNDRQTDIAGAKAAGFSTLYLHTNLTPSDQTAADPLRKPCKHLRHMELEGCDWQKITEILCNL